MKFLCAMEAVNLDNLFGDCEDLNTTRGGSLAVLWVGDEVARRLGDKVVRVISSGSSQGLLLVKARARRMPSGRCGRSWPSCPWWSMPR